MAQDTQRHLQSSVQQELRHRMNFLHLWDLALQESSSAFGTSHLYSKNKISINHLMDREKAENDKKPFPVMKTLVESSLLKAPVCANSKGKTNYSYWSSTLKCWISKFPA